jgi:hypothetical protein
MCEIKQYTGTKGMLHLVEIKKKTLNMVYKLKIVFFSKLVYLLFFLYHDNKRNRKKNTVWLEYERKKIIIIIVFIKIYI